jgi:hypothetical protein
VGADPVDPVECLYAGIIADQSDQHDVIPVYYGRPGCRIDESLIKSLQLRG